jgi:hypothetical protein
LLSFQEQSSFLSEITTYCILSMYYSVIDVGPINGKDLDSIWDRISQVPGMIPRSVDMFVPKHIFAGVYNNVHKVISRFEYFQKIFES